VGGKSEKLTEKEKIATFYVILVPGREKQKKARLTVLVSCLLNSSIYCPFVGLFLWTF